MYTWTSRKHEITAPLLGNEKPSKRPCEHAYTASKKSLSIYTPHYFKISLLRVYTPRRWLPRSFYRVSLYRACPARVSACFTRNRLVTVSKRRNCHLCQRPCEDRGKLCHLHLAELWQPARVGTCPRMNPRPTPDSPVHRRRWWASIPEQVESAVCIRAVEHQPLTAKRFVLSLSRRFGSLGRVSISSRAFPSARLASSRQIRSLENASIEPKPIPALGREPSPACGSPG